MAVGPANAVPGPSSTTLIADLSGDNQVPALTSSGSGFASFTVSPDETSIAYRLYANDTVGVTQAHIHIAASNENGPVAAFLFGPADPAVDADGLLAEGTIMASDLVASAGFDGTMTQFLSALRSGGAYVNLHTAANPPGELRGQIRPAARHLGTSISGENQNPPLMLDSSGYAGLTISADDSSVGYRLYADNTTGVTQAHIHLGGPGENGPVAAFLFGFADPAVDSDGLLASGTITEGDLVASAGFDASMGQFLDALRSGGAYVNLHTVAHPPGELRGSIHSSAFNFGAGLSGDNLIPPAPGQGSGFAAFSTNGSQDAVNYRVLTHGVEKITQAHIHLGAADENGPVIAFLFGFDAAGVTPNGTLTRGTLSASDLIAAGDFDGSMEQLVDHLRAGTAYVNVHTMANPAGAVRGQIDPLRLSAHQRGRFTDDDRSVHEGDIEAIAGAGITLGCNPPANDEFCGVDTLTRGEAAAFLNRALNLPSSATDFFTDDDGSLFEDDINGIAAFGITVGCNPPANDNYCPNDTVTRAQFASLLVRAFSLTDGAGSNLFSDDDGNVHEHDIDRLATAGITLGCNPPTNDNFCPDDLLQRDQTASFLVRAMGWIGTTP
jgi:hypothetical protein